VASYSRRLTIVGGVCDAWSVWLRGRLGTVCACVAWPAWSRGPSTSPLGGTKGRTLDSNFPVVVGRYEMTREWTVTLPGRFSRRIEDGSLVLWRPGLTVWVVVWGNDHAETRQSRLEWLRGRKSPKAFDEEVLDEIGVTRYAYRLTEDRDAGVVHALYAYAVGENGHVQAAIYFDDVAELGVAKQIWRSFERVAIQ